MNARAWFYGSSFRSTPRTPAVRAEPAPYVDTRPRVAYVLPDGTEAQIIHDHDQVTKATITYGLAGGHVVTAVRADLATKAVR